MVDYRSEDEMLGELQAIHVEQDMVPLEPLDVQTIIQMPLEADLASLNEAGMIWEYSQGELLDYSDETIACHELQPQGGEIPLNTERPMFYGEASTSVEANTVVYEEITRARCIDCDRIIDISHPIKPKRHSCEIYKRLSCEQCGMRFNVLRNLKVHQMLAHSKPEEFVPGSVCEICDNKNRKRFQRLSAFNAHLKTHVKNDNMSCSLCGLEFEFWTLFNRHRRIAHEVGDQLKKVIHGGELGYCNRCDLLMEQIKVETHRLTHNAHQKIEKKIKAREKEAVKRAMGADNRRHACGICQKTFVRPAELKRHMAVHQKTTIWKCYACDKEFAHQSGLRSHRKVVHGSEKPKYTCPVCQLIFSKKSNCDRHIKDVHPLNSKKPMTECHLCSCQYKSMGTLNKHLQKVHGVDKVTPEEISGSNSVLSQAETIKLPAENLSETLFPHKCFKCEKRFKLRSSLKIHLDVHARKEIDDPVLTDPKCPICLKHLSSRNNLRRHLLTHQNGYECPDCCQKFHSIHRLDRHRCFRAVPNPNGGYHQDILVNPATIRTRIVPTKSFFCKQCPASFYSFKAFKEHKSLHSGHKPNLCWTCHKSFRTADLLAMHKEVHNREPVYCEHCPMILNGRAQYNAHVRAVHQHRQTPLPSSSTLLPTRDVGVMSTQSEYCADRGGVMEGFRTRAQSADMEPRAMEGNSWIPMGNTDTIADRALRCPMCCHEFISVAYLTQHFANTQNERDHSFTVVQCPLCDMSVQGSTQALHHFTSIHSYVFHDPHSAQMAVFGPQEPMEPEYEVVDKKHKCPHCSSQFQKPSDLVRHIRTHTGERPYECDICSRKFSLQSSLNSHVKIHSRGDPEHECSICSSKFYKKSALSLHLRIHTGEKPLKCNYCHHSFRTSAARKLHEQTVHPIAATLPADSVAEQQPMAVQSDLPKVILAPPKLPSASLTTIVDGGFAYPAPSPKPKSVTKVQFSGDAVLDTLAQISSVEAAPLPMTRSSAFSKTRGQQQTVYIHITARRISITEYSVTVARQPPTAIREGIDTTTSVALATLKDLGVQDTPLRLTLMDNQQLSVLSKGVLAALGERSEVVLRAHPFNASMRFPVELLPPRYSDFCNRCDICDVDLPTKEISDAHFGSEDHETAQVLHPLADAVQLTIPVPAVSHHRREEVTCKLCGRKFGSSQAETEALVAHIRLEHERDHPHSMAPRPIARTAPPLEASRHQANNF